MNRGDTSARDPEPREDTFTAAHFNRAWPVWLPRKGGHSLIEGCRVHLRHIAIPDRASHVQPRWLKQPAAMAVPITTPHVQERLGCFKDELRPFTVVSVPYPRLKANAWLV
jgi:hypothetical protein